MGKRSISILLVGLLLIILTAILSFAVFSVPPDSDTNSEDTQAGMKGLSFIENVLPIDSTQYNITLEKPIPSMSIPYMNYNQTYEERYSLQSEKGMLMVTCCFQNNTLQSCLLFVRNGSVILKDSYNYTIDAAIGFLLRYQNYTNIDSTELITMLQNIDSIENKELTSGNLSLTIKSGEFQGTKKISFSWRYVLDDCEYTGLSLSFDNGTFAGFSDTRELYKIGNTTVNVSMKQAVDIAKERIKNYSYEMPGGVWISDFNVSGSSAELHSGVRESNVLYPFWQVRLYLDKQYPGSITNLLVHVWGDTGEAFFCHYDSTGHKDY
jgi:hypothetical protein